MHLLHSLKFSGKKLTVYRGVCSVSVWARGGYGVCELAGCPEDEGAWRSEEEGASGGQGQTVKLTENPVTQKKIQQKIIKKMDTAQT